MMMKDFPRRPIEPLSPQPGSFDTVLARARYRRYRRATAMLTLSAVFFAGVAGGLALGGPSGVRQFVEAAVTDDQAPSEGPTTPSTTSTSTTAATTTPKVGRKDKGREKERASAPTNPAPIVSPAPRGVRAVHGLAINAVSEPIAGLYVYAGQAGKADADRFIPSRALGKTSADGTFSLTCPGTPVLLSPWPLNAPVTATATATWAPTFTGGTTDPFRARDATCSRKSSVVETIVIQPGSAVEGTVDFPAECSEAVMPLWIWLHKDRELSIRIRELRDGDSFRVAGLPAGEHALGGNGTRTTFSVSGGGSTTSQDATFSCDPGVPSPPPTPTVEPSPSDSPTPTSSPEPSTTSETPGYTIPAPTPSASNTGVTSPAATPTPTPTSP